MSSDPSFLVAWIYQIEGTNTGSRVALWLAILAAFLHAVFGALQKGRHDPWLSRGAIDASSGLAMLPLAILVVPIPEPELWPIFLVIFLAIKQSLQDIFRKVIIVELYFLKSIKIKF